MVLSTPRPVNSWALHEVWSLRLDPAEQPVAWLGQREGCRSPWMSLGGAVMSEAADSLCAPWALCSRLILYSMVFLKCSSIFMIYLSADSPGWYVCVCVCVCEREKERERERKRESLCLKRAITGTAGLSSRVSGTEHTLKGTTLLSFKPRWFGNPTSLALCYWWEVWQLLSSCSLWRWLTGSPGERRF